eukprot:gene14754-biopygen9662
MMCAAGATKAKPEGKTCVTLVLLAGKQERGKNTCHYYEGCWLPCAPHLIALRHASIQLQRKRSQIAVEFHTWLL